MSFLSSTLMGDCLGQAFFLLLPTGRKQLTDGRLPLRALPFGVATSADFVRLRDDTDHSRARTRWEHLPF